MSQSVITATGSYLPEKILDNHALAKMVDTNDAWIQERTGIISRHIAAEGETTTDLAEKACKKLLENAPIGLSEIDGIVVATSTPDFSMPSVATKLQERLGLQGAAVDVAAACTGFIYALATAHGWIQTGLAKNILVLGAETMSRIIDWSDRGTCILFGDGAGAVLLQSQTDEQASGRGIHALSLCADGKFAPLLGTNGGTSSTQTAGELFMSGKEIFRHGVEKMTDTTLQTLKKAGHNIDDLDFLIPHQANVRMIHKIGRRLKIDEKRCIITVENHGNTSAASIPLALDVAVRDGRVKPGTLIAMPALGAGLTWGCCVVTY
jgi:3-oxoacyl-[acyl-carrier-protein] synthase-3